MRKGFIGIGVMGFPMAGHLSSNGFDVCIFNRSQEKASNWVTQFNGSLCSSPLDMASQCDIIILCVGKDEDVKDVICGENGILKSIKPGTIIIDHTTTSATLSKDMNQILQDKKAYFLDAPISGGQAGAEEGKLSIMVGGDKQAFIKVKDILGAYSKFVKYMGSSGSGQLTKMVNQICIGGLLQALAEGINFSEKAGLNTEDVMEVITKGAAQSWYMENRWSTMLNNEYDHGFAVDWMKKDLDIVEDQAKRIGANIQVTQLVNNFYKEIQELDGGRWDASSLLKRIKD
ncbi:MAG: NAD(P)-dependent oxidoreductase [Gammaproteobacteria bacterium]|uniref:NAD(P)-dependent oxidoreductase n=1 Tax=SAR86 cluster bacterium TaxID=2030880 RepID=A0A520MPS5_9GAMM|nr:MAG: NAD(P)-dependent oxidoreductase [SAR86 cluster bacterium]|tara:strand:+ start:317 stop:1180 length:864 start_codon:yes stop_codon:yes gene_type:complete